MERKDDIKMLLTALTEGYTEIIAIYNISLHHRQVDIKLPIKIKNYLENARSVLDYLGREIADKIGILADSKVYFPIVEKNKCVKSFRGSVGRNLPGLEIERKDIFDLLESFQPYHADYTWLGDFNNILNVNKHDHVVPQKRIDTQRTTIHNAQGSVSWGTGVRFGNGVSVMGARIDPQTQLPVSTQGIDVKVETWVDFLFDDGKNVSVIGILNAVNKYVPDIVEKVESIL